MRWRALASVLAIGTACADTGEDQVPLPPAVLLLMECVECASGELTPVAALGESVVPLLRQLLDDGPPAPSVERMRRTLGATRLPAAPPGGAAGSLTPGVIAAQLADYTRLYRLRAALALGAIGGPAARDALCGARSRLTGDSAVVQAIDSAVSVGGAPPCR